MSRQDAKEGTQFRYEWMRHLGGPKAAIVGHGRGARVATHFAKDYPDAIDRLVVMDNTRDCASVSGRRP